MNDTVEQQPVDDLHKEIAAAFDEQEAAEEVETEEEAEELEGETEEITDETEESEEETEEELEPLDPPVGWNAEDRERFAQIPRDAQEVILRREKERDADYSRGKQEIAQIRKKSEAISEVFEPYRQELAINGLDEVGAVRQLLAIRDELRNDPKSTLLSLAQQYGVDFQQVEEDVDPAVLNLRNELNSIKQEQAQRDAMVQQQEHEGLIQQVESFKNETDEKGALKHPHFEELRADMGRLINSGLAGDMSEAYQKSLALRSDLTLQESKAEPKAEIKEKVKKAKKAATGVKSGGTAKKSESKTWREEIEAQFATYS
jgi:hypothetical protein